MFSFGLSDPPKHTNRAVQGFDSCTPNHDPATPTLRGSDSPNLENTFDSAARIDFPQLSPIARHDGVEDSISRLSKPMFSGRANPRHVQGESLREELDRAGLGGGTTSVRQSHTPAHSFPLDNGVQDNDLAHSLSGFSLRAAPLSMGDRRSGKVERDVASPFAQQCGISPHPINGIAGSADESTPASGAGREAVLTSPKGIEPAVGERAQNGDLHAAPFLEKEGCSVRVANSEASTGSGLNGGETPDAQGSGCIGCATLSLSPTGKKCLSWPRSTKHDTDGTERNLIFDDKEDLLHPSDSVFEETCACVGSGLPPAGPAKGKKKTGLVLNTRELPSAFSVRMLNRAESFARDDSVDVRMLSRVPSIGRDSSSGIDSISEQRSPVFPPTPTSPDPTIIQQANVGDCPPTPNRRARARAYRQSSFDSGAGVSQTPYLPLMRRNSLTDSKVLVETKQLARTDSVINPHHFKFLDHFEYIRDIGSTKTSEVYMARHRFDRREYAIKKKREKFSNARDRERCLHEIKAVIELPRHRNVVGMYRAWQQDGYFYIQMDFCPGGSLQALLRNAIQRQQQLDDDLVWHIMADISSGLEFLHRSSVAHLDIKPDNVYRDKCGNFCVGDFGMAVLRNEWAAEDGDGDYVAPEMLSSHNVPGTAADIYSLGVTMYECATLKKLPRSGAGRLAENIFTPARPHEMQQLIRRMMAQRPELRPTAGEVMAAVNRASLQLHSVPSPKPSRSPALRVKRTSTTRIEDLHGAFSMGSPMKALGVGNTSRRLSRSEDGDGVGAEGEARCYDMSPEQCDSPDLNLNIRDSAPTPTRMFNASSSMDSPGAMGYSDEDCVLEISRDSCEQLPDEA